MKNRKKTRSRQGNSTTELPEAGINLPGADDPEMPTRPNILMIMVDEYRFPRYSEGFGMKEAIKNIVGFRPGDTSDYEKYFPGLMRLRENAVVLNNHTIASSACIPSRAALFTGQYGTRTGVTQTDGVFKSGHNKDFNWLKPFSAPTMGDWLKASGYDTYYFGKCHFADPPSHSLKQFGFDEWENSWPEPHGTLENNLGFYRDHGFTDLVTTFLHGKGLGLGYDRQQAENDTGPSEVKPWFAVASFTNPHDITTWPVLAGKVDPHAKLGEPLMVPPKGTKSNPPVAGTWQIPLNPDGFPQYTADLPPNFDEVLDQSDANHNNKPACHFEYSLKLGVALASKTGIPGIVKNAPLLTGIPFPLADDPEKWARAYIQYYTYLQYVVDKHIDKVMKTLDDTGLSDNTIVLFVPDHGEYGAAHGGMLQKWHTAYQETLQVPVVVCLPGEKKIFGGKGPVQIDKLTSHIDLLPTLLGLAEADATAAQTALESTHHNVYDLVGANLTDLIYGRGETITEPDQDGTERQGVLFATDDMITEYLPDVDDPASEEKTDYDLYLQMVDYYKSEFPYAANLSAGPVAQPCHLVCYREKEWKLVRYADKPADQVTGAENFNWELYHLPSDPDEMNNLLVATDNPIKAVPRDNIPPALDGIVIEHVANTLHTRMNAQIDWKLRASVAP